MSIACSSKIWRVIAMAIMAQTAGARGGGMTRDEKFVIFASSLGSVFEFYDFYLYAVLAPFFASLFFPAGNDTAALLSAFATYAAGFLVRPFGALIFGRLGDLVGRKYINQSISRFTSCGVFEGWLLVEGTDFLGVVL
jgi:MFS family permease